MMAGTSPADADVMEINGSQHTWVAGGPHAEPVAPAAGDASAEALPASLTEVADTAGPAEFQTRVAQLAAKFIF